MGGVGGSDWGVRVDVIEELKFLENSQKTYLFFFFGGGGGRVLGRGGSRGGQGGCERRIEVFIKFKKKILFFGGGAGSGGGSGGGSGWWGGWVRVDVNAMLGVGGDVGYGGCEPRVEGIVQGTKRYCTILRK